MHQFFERLSSAVVALDPYGKNGLGTVPAPLIPIYS
jgi:hypothetical protein